MRTVGDLPTPWRDDPYLVGECAQHELVIHASDDEACVLGLRDHDGTSVVGLGAPEAVARLLTQRTAAFVALGARWATLPRGTWAHVAPDDRAALLGTPEGGTSHWDWMYTRAPLDASAAGAAGAAGLAVVRLEPGPEVDVLVAECLGRAHPVASTLPGDPRLTAWWAVVDETRPVAVVGSLDLFPGAPAHLVSLGVDPAYRGRGLAGTVLAAAVKDGLRRTPVVGDPMVHLGLYASNDAARRVYTRLGFVLAHEMESVRRAAAATGG